MKTYVALIFWFIFATAGFNSNADTIVLDLSEEMIMGFSAEKLENGNFLIKIPPTYNEAPFSYAYFSYGDDQSYETEPNSLSIPMEGFKDNDYHAFMLTIGNEMISQSKIFLTYKRPSLLCIEGSFKLIGLDKLVYSKHWRETDKQNLLKKAKQLRKGMSLKKVWATLGHPRFESSPFPRSLTETKDGYVLEYILEKDPMLNQMVSINFDKNIKFKNFTSKNIDLKLTPPL